jgi:hypothetical protein
MRAAALLQQASSSMRPSAAKPWPPTVCLARDVDVDVGPAGEPARHRGRELGVGVVDAADRLVGEHDAEAERVVGALRSQTVIWWAGPAAS